ncbi:MAG: hypothetical protein AAF721_34500 [Myxococcota bacterium]
MANRRSKFLVLGLAAAAAYGAWTVGSSLLSDDAETEGTKYVVNHVWLERLPQNQRDMIGHVAIIDHPQGRVGVVGKSSNWRHFIEVFMWKLQGKRLELFFPQEEQRSKVTVNTYDCEGDAPHPFEICMDVSGGRHTTTFYSRRDWKIEPHDVEGSMYNARTQHARPQHACPQVTRPHGTRSRATTVNLPVLRLPAGRASV